MTTRPALLDLGHDVGDPRRDWVLSAEGNISSRSDERHMIIKASGCSMQSMTDDDLLVVDRLTILGLLDMPVILTASSVESARAKSP